MRERMFSRGPDGSGEWFSDDGRVGIGHRRLSIIDLSPAGDQPMFNADRSLAITFNGEIYNYVELRAQLAGKGYPFRSHCDTEVILALYTIYGIDGMMNHLRGMYAFAIWDQKKQGLLLARDPFGIKPLYYSDNGDTFRLASQVKALRAGDKIDLAPDPAGHVGFFLWGHVPDPYTMFKHIRSLPAGSTMWVGRDGAKSPRIFCDIASVLADAEKLKPETRLDAGDQRSDTRRQREILRTSLQETVRYHMVADVPVGVFLSAGLDSTTIAALAAEHGGILRTVTLGFEEYKGTESDETPLAEEFAKRCGATHQTIWVSRADFEAERDHLFESMDRPSTDGVNTFFVSLAAKQANLKVALSGVGGDELFATYPSFRDIPRTVGLLKPIRPLLSTFGREFRVLSAPVLKRFTSPKYAGMLEYGGTYGGAYLLRRGMFMPWELPDLLEPEIVREGWAELQTLARLEESLDGIKNSRVKVSALELQWYMRHQLLRDSDWAGMGHSVEIRVPLVDIDFVKQIAPMLSRPDAPSKRDMAAAASELMTPEILDRPKTGFQIPVRQWMMEDNRSERDRGLRGWAKHVYRRFGGLALRRPQVRATRSRSKDIAATSGPDQIHGAPKRILVFRIGQLGDTIVALPAMWVVRKSFADAHIVLLCDLHPGKAYVTSSTLLRGSKIFDEYLSYPVSESNDLWRKGVMARLLASIRAKRFDTLVYLAPTGRKPEQIERDRRFFQMAGIKNFIGMRGFKPLEAKQAGVPLRRSPSESELLLQRLAASGIEITPEDSTRTDPGLGPEDDAPVYAWLKGLPNDGGRTWVAVGPGSKMPSKRWPLKRFETVIRELINQFDIWPVVFGGEEDRIIGDWLLKKWGRGYNAAGALNIRSGLAAMKRCQFFIGNDTGTMHMAAAVGLSCVAIFSSRERPGLWYPHGTGHKIFRTPIDCEGCGLVECLERGNECINRITTGEVLDASRDVLKARIRVKPNSLTEAELISSR